MITVGVSPVKDGPGDPMPTQAIPGWLADERTATAGVIGKLTFE